MKVYSFEMVVNCRWGSSNILGIPRLYYPRNTANFRCGALVLGTSACCFEFGRSTSAHEFDDIECSDHSNLVGCGSTCCLWCVPVHWSPGLLPPTSWPYPCVLQISHQAKACFGTSICGTILMNSGSLLPSLYKTSG
jgi:hypothetical protein